MVATPPAPYRSLPGPSGPEPQKVSEAFRPRRRKSVQNSLKLSQTPEIVLRLFRTLFRPRGRKAPGDSVGDFLGFRARRARETPVRGWQGRNSVASSCKGTVATCSALLALVAWLDSASRELSVQTKKGLKWCGVKGVCSYSSHSGGVSSQESHSLHVVPKKFSPRLPLFVQIFLRGRCKSQIRVETRNTLQFGCVAPNSPLAHRNRSDFCDLRLRCPLRTPEIAAISGTRESNAALRFKGAMESR